MGACKHNGNSCHYSDRAQLEKETFVTADAFLFWLLSLVTVFGALSVVLFKNPIYCALSLVMTMVGVAALFVTLNAYFLAGVQLIVYAGAVMVLFVMVLMLFDLKHELKAFSRGAFTGALKLISVGAFAGLVVGAVMVSLPALPELNAAEAQIDSTRELGLLLFTQYIFGFEALGVLLLVIAVGAVALARSKGGTHVRH